MANSDPTSIRISRYLNIAHDTTKASCYVIKPHILSEFIKIANCGIERFLEWLPP